MKTKLLATALALLLTLPVLSGCSEQDPNAPDGFKTASNDKMEYALFVPESWIVDTAEDSMMLSARASEYISTNISMISYTNEDYEVKTDENGKELSPVPEYWNDYKKDLEKLFDSDEEGKSTFVLNEDSSGKTTIIGSESLKKNTATGYTYVYSGTLGGVELQYMQVIIYQKNTFYLFTYTSIPDQYEEYLDEIEEILSYIELP